VCVCLCLHVRSFVSVCEKERVHLYVCMFYVGARSSLQVSV